MELAYSAGFEEGSSNVNRCVSPVSKIIQGEKNMKSYLILTVISAACLFAACGNKTGVPIEFSKACSPENEKKYVEIGGVLAAKGGVFCSNIGGGRIECGFTLKEKPGDDDGVRVDIEQGSSSNSVEKLQSGYKPEDIKIRDNSGNLISLADKVRLTGEMNVMPDGKFCFLKVTKIEK